MTRSVDGPKPSQFHTRFEVLYALLRLVTNTRRERECNRALCVGRSESKKERNKCTCNIGLKLPDPNGARIREEVGKLRIRGHFFQSGLW
jgi:hypothetical protein